MLLDVPWTRAEPERLLRHKSSPCQTEEPSEQDQERRIDGDANRFEDIKLIDRGTESSKQLVKFDGLVDENDVIH